MSLWNQEREAYVIWFAVIGWAGGVFSCCRGVRSKNNLPGVILAERRLRGVHLLFSPRPNEASHAGIKAESFPVGVEVQKLYLLRQGGTFRRPPPERESEREKGARPLYCIYHIFTIRSCLTYSSSIMKWWEMVIHSIAPRLQKHVYLGYLRKVFEPALLFSDRQHNPVDALPEFLCFALEAISQLCMRKCRWGRTSICSYRNNYGRQPAV